MSFKLKISSVVIGGTGVNNPVPLTLDNYRLNPAELALVYQQLNVTAFHSTLRVQLQVTGLVLVDQSGHPMIHDNDDVYMPCPPFCD